MKTSFYIEWHKDTYKIKNYSPFSIATITNPPIFAIIFPVIVLYSFFVEKKKWLQNQLRMIKKKKKTADNEVWKNPRKTIRIIENINLRKCWENNCIKAKEKEDDKIPLYEIEGKLFLYFALLLLSLLLRLDRISPSIYHSSATNGVESKIRRIKIRKRKEANKKIRTILFFFLIIARGKSSYITTRAMFVFDIYLLNFHQHEMCLNNPSSITK